MRLTPPVPMTPTRPAWPRAGIQWRLTVTFACFSSPLPDHFASLISPFPVGLIKARARPSWVVQAEQPYGSSVCRAPVPTPGPSTATETTQSWSTNAVP